MKLILSGNLSGVRTVGIAIQKITSVIAVECHGIHKYFLYRMIGFAQTVN